MGLVFTIRVVYWIGYISFPSFRNKSYPLNNNCLGRAIIFCIIESVFLVLEYGYEAFRFRFDRIGLGGTAFLPVFTQISSDFSFRIEGNRKDPITNAPIHVILRNVLFNGLFSLFLPAECLFVIKIIYPIFTVFL